MVLEDLRRGVSDVPLNISCSKTLDAGVEVKIEIKTKDRVQVIKENPTIDDFKDGCFVRVKHLDSHRNPEGRMDGTVGMIGRVKYTTKWDYTELGGFVKVEFGNGQCWSYGVTSLEIVEEPKLVEFKIGDRVRIKCRDCGFSGGMEDTIGKQGTVKIINSYSIFVGIDDGEHWYYQKASLEKI